MTDPLHTEPVEVTQADEFRADDFWEETDGLMEATFADLKLLLAKHRTAAEAASRAEVERLREALGNLIAACDAGRTVPKGGACGMTIEAQIRASVINGVPAWPVEEARAALTASEASDGGEG